MGQHRRITIAPLAVLVLAVSGCAVNGLSFRADERINMVRPEERSEVPLPLVVDWEAGDLADGDVEATYAVLLDRTPPRPGRTLESIFENSDECTGVDGCPDDAFLASRQIYRTTDTELTIDQVPILPEDNRGFHTVTVILLDVEGHRSGEGAWSRRFTVTGEG